MSKAKYIDPMIGTVGDVVTASVHGGGKTHPGACVPGGMVHVSPDTVTGADNGTGYNYCQDTIEGFSFNHMSGIGWYGDLGNVQIMPIVGETDLRSGSNHEIPFEKGTEGWKSSFTHEKEHAKAGYYSVELERYGIFTEATAAAHTGLLRVTYPQKDDCGLLFNFSRRIAGHADFEHVEIVSDTKLEGYIICTPAGGGFGRGAGRISYNLYFVCELSRPAKDFRFFANEEYQEAGLKSFEHQDVGLIARFDTAEPVVLKCGISYVDLDGARKNLATECQDFDFDGMSAKAFDAWEKAFNSIEVTGSNEVDKTLFYTCLYHTMMDPRITADVDGRIRCASGKIQKVDYTQRTMFSGWDVYRSEFPLLTIMCPEVVNDEVSSLLQIAEEKNSSFPRWEMMGIDSKCMIGDPGLIVVADAYVKGIRNFDGEKAYKYALASNLAKDTLDGKPFDSLHPASKEYLEDAFAEGLLSDTLEFLLSDYALAKFAEALGKKEDAEYFMNRVRRYKENYNPETGFMGPRNAGGSFVPVKGEYDEEGCVESNIFQQSWFAPYDVKGLEELFGSKRMVELLERLFAGADLTALWNDNYNHSNEPCHNITHYFNYIGLAHRTQYWTRRVQKEAYRLGAFGFCGNEDVGQLSAWYVLSSFGLAQICAGKPIYDLNTPLFKTAKMALNPKYHSCAVSNTFEVICDQDPLEYPYIDRVYWNGKELDRLYLTFEEITAGGTLEFKLSVEPCTDKEWKIPENDL